MSLLRSNKAVAEGGVSFYLEHFVSARIIKVTYGTVINTSYDPSDPEHVARNWKKIVRPSGRVVVPEFFSSILTKVSRPLSHLKHLTDLHHRFGL